MLFIFHGYISVFLVLALSLLVCACACMFEKANATFHVSEQVRKYEEKRRPKKATKTDWKDIEVKGDG